MVAVKERACAVERPGRAARMERGDVRLRERRGDVGTTLGHDALEEVGHAGAASAAARRWLVATKRSRTWPAAPSSMAAAPSTVPARTLLGSPATEHAGPAIHRIAVHVPSLSASSK